MKKRLDVLLTELDPSLTRSKAQTMIMSGIVYVNNQKETKSGSMFPEDALVEVRGESLKYVSRGGLKLEKAMECFPVSPSGKVCMDIGSSTGGFTDCMLQNGALKVYCVDVGKGLLDYKLRNDPRVVVMEKTNIRYLKPEEMPEKINFASVDVSFISLTLVIPAALLLLDDHKEMVMLIKPQFEAGREKVGKKGVVRDPAVHEEVIEKIYDFASASGLSAVGLDFSPVKGPEGNIEYLIYVNADGGQSFDRSIIKDVVKRAHDRLDKTGQTV
ncbi:MAG: TlyA family RNA methyltransferase [Parasporobacterium sp.]|nr:TlyA family RNA methyltransferase [Parasporobacterium sp.]